MAFFGIPRFHSWAWLLLLSAVLAAGSPAPAVAQAIDAAQAAAASPEQQRAQAIRSQYTKFEYRVPMRDGVRLFTSVYLPRDASANRRYPILMVRTPYSVGPYGADRYRDRLGPSEAYEREGFIFVFQDVRGTYMSEGEFVNMRPHRPVKRLAQEVDESSDTHDTIEWLLKHLAHHNGKVGQWGISYPGFYTSAGAIDSHPALKAVSPQAPIADWFIGDDMHRNGAFNLQMAFGFFSGFGRPRPEPVEKRSGEPFKFGTVDGYQFFLDLGPLSNVDKHHFKGGVPFWNEVAAHPNYDAFWQARNILPHLKNVRAAVLTVGGWYDTEDLYGPLQTFKAIRQWNPSTPSHLVMGPWTHGGWGRGDGDRVGDAHFGFKTSASYQPRELAFFKHHLKGGDPHGLPVAWVFETGANRWREFDAWPPRSVRERALHLRQGGRLSLEPAPAEETGKDDYLSDPSKPVPYTTEIATGWSKDYIAADQRFSSRRPDVLSWQSEVLTEDLTLAGPLEAELFVSITGSDADFIVKLIDVNPPDLPGEKGQPNRGNQQTLVRGEPFRARFRDGFETPKPMVPGQVTRVAFTLNDVLHTFKRGHRVMVQVQSSWFPFIDRNPQTFVPNLFEAVEADFIKATHFVHRGPGQASRLKVKVLPPADDTAR